MKKNLICFININNMSNKKWNTNNFITFCNKKFGEKWNYSLVNYKSYDLKIKIICPIHGIFKQTLRSHFKGCGCPKCGNLISKPKLKEKDIIKRFTNIHKEKWNYSLSEYKGKSIKTKIICSTHGIFEQIPSNHLQGKGCPKCNSSKDEIKIRKWLKKSNFKFYEEKRFKQRFKMGK